ncbi:MAG TPA: hypothetical protein VGZ22_20020 [Isosphaeraceae bacterium]|nr:hypothetical protein [Isosphaeraceae bacterium]
MARQPRRKAVKIGVKVGGGVPPGFLWNVEILNQAFDETMAFANEDQYAHLACQVRDLAMEEDPTHSNFLDVRSIEDFYELREKGGILQKLNVRVFYFPDKESRTIVILGSIKKENNGPTPTGDRLTMRRRKRLYLEAKRSRT